MIDIVSIGTDLNLADSQTTRAKNIMQTQVGSLQYAQTLGIDLDYFLDDQLRFQNESFRSYLIQTLAQYSINVAEVITLVDSLQQKYVFSLSPAETEGSLISR